MLVYNLYRIAPQENMSQTSEYRRRQSVRLAISGATYPGVPHLGKEYFLEVLDYASPKSTIFIEAKSPFLSNMIFSGFKSRCIIYRLWM
jgi:hypothetical protein